MYCTVLYLPGGGAALEGVADEVAAVLQPEEGSRALVVLQRLLVNGPLLHPRLVTQHGAGLLWRSPILALISIHIHEIQKRRLF